LARFGVEPALCRRPTAAPGSSHAPQHPLLFAETPTNPLTDLCDIAALAAIAHDAGALLAVDNCFASPALQRPAMLGADLVIHSGTKFLDGQGRVMAGAVCGPRSIIDDKLAPLIRSAGMNLSPFNAWVVLKGLETLACAWRRRAPMRWRWPAGWKPIRRWRACTTPACLAPAARAGHAPAVGRGRCRAVFDVRARAARGAHAPSM
jgi:O-succinylhomoserine sulfhydrylase